MRFLLGGMPVLRVSTMLLLLGGVILPAGPAMAQEASGAVSGGDATWTGPGADPGTGRETLLYAPEAADHTRAAGPSGQEAARWEASTQLPGQSTPTAEAAPAASLTPPAQQELERRRRLVEDVLEDGQSFDPEALADRWLLWAALAFVVIMVSRALFQAFSLRRRRARGRR
jgi:hypothetical protein